MSGVDVLAVLDAELEGWECGSEPHNRLAEARAAVAELIEAAEAAIAELYRVTPSQAHPRLRAALARVQGGQP